MSKSFFSTHAGAITTSSSRALFPPLWLERSCAQPLQRECYLTPALRPHPESRRAAVAVGFLLITRSTPRSSLPAVSRSLPGEEFYRRTPILLAPLAKNDLRLPDPSRRIDAPLPPRASAVAASTTVSGPYAQTVDDPRAERSRPGFALHPAAGSTLEPLLRAMVLFAGQSLGFFLFPLLDQCGGATCASWTSNAAT